MSITKNKPNPSIPHRKHAAIKTTHAEFGVDSVLVATWEAPVRLWWEQGQCRMYECFTASEARQLGKALLDVAAAVDPAGDAS